MARKATGSLVVKQLKSDVSYAMRLPYQGKRIFEQIGLASEGWTHARAQQHMEDTVAAIRIGQWAPAPRVLLAAAPTGDPTFHEFASEWWDQKKGSLTPATATTYEQEITTYLLPFFRNHTVSQITVQEVDRFKAWMLKRKRKQHSNSKLPAQPLSHTTVNKSLTRLGQILESAYEMDLISRNPVKVGKRKLPPPKRRQVWLDSALHIETLINACEALEHDQGLAKTSKSIGRKPLLATLVFAGLRAGEACQLRWRYVDLANGRLYPDGLLKSQKAYREIDILPVLHDLLVEWKAITPWSGPDDLVFPSNRGTMRTANNVLQRVVRPAVRKADEMLVASGKTPLPSGITSHKLRHTFASILVALGVDIYSVMDQLGHADPALTLKVYTHMMKRSQAERDALKLLVKGSLTVVQSALIGTKPVSSLPVPSWRKHP